MKRSARNPIEAAVTRRSGSGTLYLVSELIQPGDVILSLGDEETSRQIAGVTGGPFSHAAIVSRPDHLLESIDDGIGETRLAVGRMEEREGSPTPLLEFAHVDAALVLRHPELEAIDHDELVEVMKRIMTASSAFLGQRYPSLYKLAPALPPLHPISLFAGAFKSVLVAAYPPEAFEGPFCSFLVALIYEQLGLSLFRRKRKPGTVNPNDFLKSLLKPVADAVTTADPKCRNRQDLVDLANKPYGSYPSRTATIEGHRSQLQARHTAKEIFDRLQKFQAEMRRHS